MYKYLKVVEVRTTQLFWCYNLKKLKLVSITYIVNVVTIQSACETTIKRN